MRGHTHMIGGAAAWLGACIPLHAAGAVAVLGGAAAAWSAPWPDLDNLGAWSGRRRLGRGPVSRHIRVRRRPVKHLAAWVVTRFGSHRLGPLHSVWAAVGAVVLWLAPAVWLPGWPLWAAAAAGVGVLSHPLLDLLNDKPVALLWPLPALRPLGLMRVGGRGEIVFQVVLAVAAVAALLHVTGGAR